MRASLLWTQGFASGKGPCQKSKANHSMKSCKIACTSELIVENVM